MQRRRFLRILTALLGLSPMVRGPFGLLVRSCRAETNRRVLPADTDLSTLLFENPAHMDTRNLPITPLERFETMGLSNHAVDLSQWRLTVGGAVANPLALNYDQLRRFPVLERSVLLICPGVFAFHARWKGLSIETLLRQAGADDRTTHVDVRGPTGPYAKLQRFPMRAVRSGKVFLAYAVNGRTLPQQHGYPLRAVSEDDVGSEWIKYADTVEAVIVENVPRDDRPPGNGPPVFVP
jgi:sulfoxide reductase catalytic subunit YedY